MILPGLPRLSSDKITWSPTQRQDLLSMWQDIARAITANFAGTPAPANPNAAIITPPPTVNGDFILGAGGVNIKDAGYAIVPVSAGGTGMANGFQDGPWTPGISFGGATTGITYAAQLGRYLLITVKADPGPAEQWCFLSGTILLSNEGSATGTLLVTGVPFPAVNLLNYNAAVTYFISGFQSLTGGVQGAIAASGTTLSMYQTKNGAPMAMDNTDATNSSFIVLSCFYKVN